MKTFAIDPKLNYQEMYRNNEQINKYYELENLGTNFNINTIPDACVDIQFVLRDDNVITYACGSFLQSAKSPTSHQNWCFGVKFQPGCIPLMLRKDIMNLIGHRKIIDDEVWLNELAQQIFNANSFPQRIEIFEKSFPFNEQFSGENQIASYVMKRIKEERGCINIGSLANEMQYNQRYMDRVFRSSTGLTMKKYATIIKIQTAIRYLTEERFDDVYERLGYYDQSYFIKEFKKYTSMTPRQYCKENRINIV